MLLQSNRFLKSIPITLLVGMLFACGPDKEGYTPPVRDTNMPLATTYMCTLDMTDAGYPMVRLLGPQMDNYKRNTGQEMVMPEGLTAIFYDSVLQPRATLTAGFGTFQQSRRLMIVRDNVNIVSVDGDTLQTEQLTWFMDSVGEKSRDNAIYTDKYVHIYKDDTRLDGMGMFARADFSKTRILNLQGDLTLPEEEDNTNNTENDAQVP